jgi:hypothetical protein
MWNRKPVMKKLILAIILTLAFSQAVGAIPILDPNNGHYYEFVKSGTIWWPQAKEQSDNSSYPGLSGHLATLTTFEENDWVSAILNPGSKWIDAIQDVNAPNYSEPDGGWKWVTGEAWGYTTWLYGEPNNSTRDEVHLESFFQQRWNDRSSSLDGYTVEYEPAPVPTTMLLLGFGLIVFAGFRKKSKK